MLVNPFFNMAPESKTLEPGLTFNFATAKADMKQLEFYFHINKIKDEKKKISLFLTTLDNESANIVVKNFKTYENVTWRALQFRVKKESQNVILFKMLAARQKLHETTSTWLERIIKIAKDADLEENYAKQLITETALYDISSLQFLENFRNDSLYENYERKVMLLKEVEKRHAIKKQLEDDKTQAKLKESEQETLNKDKMRCYLVNNINTTINDIKTKTVQINGEVVTAIEDTASDINIISKNLAEEKGLIIQKTEKVKVTTFFKQETHLNEYVDVTIKIDNIIINAEFYVAEELISPLLVGNPFIKTVERKKHEIGNLKNKYAQVFDDKPTSGYSKIMCHIDTKEGKKVNIKKRNISRNETVGAQKAIEKLLKSGYIEPSTSSWCNPIRPVAKPNGETRITCNMQFLNNIVEDNNYTIPKINEVIEKTQGHKYFTILDLEDGFFQINIAPEDKHKTAFYFKNNLYQYTRMPQGFKNSPGIFQMIMDDVLKDIMEKKCMVYMDDIIVYGKTEEEHDTNLNAVLSKLRESKLKVNYRKMQYKDSKVKLLGYLIDGTQIKPIGEHQRKVLDFKTPFLKKELQSFLGFGNYYRKFIPNHATLTEPLYNALRGLSDHEKLVWTEECDAAFKKLKEKINSNIAVNIPDFNKDFILTTDASLTGIGACLQQEINGELVVIDWASKKLSSAEQKYPVTEREFLAMAWSIKHYDYYLKGRKFKVITDHSALLSSRVKHIFGNLKLERMRETLQQYTFSIEYKKGCELVDADTISRIYGSSNEKENKDLPKNVLVDKNGIWYYRLDNNEIKLFPDVGEREELLKKAHEVETYHGGRDAMLYTLKKTYYWPKLQDSVMKHIKNCLYCQCNLQKTEGGEEYIETESPLEKVGVDLMFLEQGIPILTLLDYHTRKVDARILKSKSNNETIRAIKEVLNEMGIPKEIIMDNGREFVSNEFNQWCNENNIKVHKTSPGKHQSNGRVERFNRTLWQALRKFYAEGQETKIEDELKIIIERINNTYHRALNGSPNEMWNGNLDPAVVEKAKESYKKEFKKHFREQFEEGEVILVQDINTNTSSLKADSKFILEGKVIKKLEKDSYLIQLGNKSVKRNHAQMKKIIAEVEELNA